MNDELLNQVGPCLVSTREGDPNQAADTMATQGQDEYDDDDADGKPHAVVAKPGPTDVLFGRGAFTYRHAGNKSYREQVKSYKNKHNNARTKAEKDEIYEEIIVLVRSRRPPGRFLIANSEGGGWVIAPAKRVVEKVKEAFKEPKSASSSSQEEDGAVIHDRDLALDFYVGRGGDHNNQANLELRCIARARRVEYQNAKTKQEKEDIIEEVIAEWRRMSRSWRRFVEKSKDGSLRQASKLRVKKVIQQLLCRPCPAPGSANGAGTSHPLLSDRSAGAAAQEGGGDAPGGAGTNEASNMRRHSGESAFSPGDDIPRACLEGLAGSHLVVPNEPMAAPEDGGTRRPAWEVTIPEVIGDIEDPNVALEGHGPIYMDVDIHLDDASSPPDCDDDRMQLDSAQACNRHTSVSSVTTTRRIAVGFFALGAASATPYYHHYHHFAPAYPWTPHGGEVSGLDDGEAFAPPGGIVSNDEAGPENVQLSPQLLGFISDGLLLSAPPSPTTGSRHDPPEFADSPARASLSPSLLEWSSSWSSPWPSPGSGMSDLGDSA